LTFVSFISNIYILYFYFSKPYQRRPNGKITYNFENRDRYVGHARNGILDGKGILFYGNNGNEGKKYIGDWKNVKKELI